MPSFDTRRERASWLVAILGIVIVIALFPYASGLLGAPVLYVIFAPLHEWLTPRLRSRVLAAAVVLVLALVGFVLPIVFMVFLLAGQAPDVVRSVLAWPLLERLDTLRIGSYELGPQIKEIGTSALSFLGGSAISLLGTATRVTLNILFTFFGLFYILMDPNKAWAGARPAIPFSDANVEILRERFSAVTKSTIIGTGLAALTQGGLVCLAFLVAGLPTPLFWGAVTVLLSILPVVGSGLVWAPAALLLFTQGRVGMGVMMVLWGMIAVANVDSLIRPYVANRYANIHPLITLVGAVAGVSYIGIIGLLIGPLALSYFFELLAMYQREYLPGLSSPPTPPEATS